jgi:hypothetical protein
MCGPFSRAGAIRWQLPPDVGRRSSEIALDGSRTFDMTRRLHGTEREVDMCWQPVVMARPPLAGCAGDDLRARVERLEQSAFRRTG